MRFRHTQNRKRATDGGTRERKKEDPSFKFFFFINIFRDEVPPKKEENRCVRYTRRRRKPEGFHPTGGIGCFSASFFPSLPFRWRGNKRKIFVFLPFDVTLFQKECLWVGSNIRGIGSRHVVAFWVEAFVAYVWTSPPFS